MKIKYRSFFKDTQTDKAWLEGWVKKIEHLNNRTYQQIELDTGLGKTCVYGINTRNEELESIVIFPGARTSVLFWDFDNNLDHLGNRFRIFLVETNGLPNLSDGNTPDIHSWGYGEWAAEVIEKLKLKETHIAGASFGGLVCMKLCITNPEKVKAAFLLNPGCLQPFSLSVTNLYHNILPIVAPTKKNVLKFLYKAVLCKPNHQLSENAEELIVDYEVFALTRYKDNTQKPYYMKDELKQVKTDTYLLLGDKDLLFPHRKSIENAKSKITSLKEIVTFENVGHGIETYNKAIHAISTRIR
jgi:pimeloyl-ACP methyl ester carboxylesterase